MDGGLRGVDHRSQAISNGPMFSLSELASLVGGEVVGPEDTVVSGIAPFESAGPGDITLAAGAKYLCSLETCAAAAAIVPRHADSPAKPLLRVENPKLAFALILDRFTRQPFDPLGISPLASIGRDCRIAERVSIHPFVALGRNVVVEEEVTLGPGTSVGDDCRIGRGSTLHANVTLYPGVRLGANVVIHSGTVIGADGFGYVFDGTRQVKIAQTGCVEIGDEVEIGANCCVDRATFGATVIERHVKLDNLVHIGHNCRIGENTIIVGCVGVSGSVEIGRNCVVAGQAGFADHVKVGDGAKIYARAAVFKDVPPGGEVSGVPAQDNRRELKMQAALRRLPEWMERRRRSGE
jgi:UDP-3-O-[3-hydroxymyristoyl] glucosamine N-acyltransferase